MRACPPFGRLVRAVPCWLAGSLAACTIFGSSPAARSPLRERLSTADTSRIEDAARACLSKSGWKVDPVGGLSGGANVVSASKAKDETNLYIQPPEINPRITGGPDYGDPFWSCLGGELSLPGSAASESSPAQPDEPKKPDKTAKPTSGEDEPKPDHAGPPHH
ncbi:MAG: hypothetical protein JOZ69_05830 [Myxococcales bacterium]|nr:hypothetical protein [Myxococcales bacterium]